MSKSATEYIQHVLNEIDFLGRQREQTTKEKFLRDGVLQRAFARSLEIIGEAIKQIPADIREQYSAVDWKSLAGLRDKLIHHYFGVDYEIVWDVIVNELPGIKEALQQVLSNLSK